MPAIRVVPSALTQSGDALQTQVAGPLLEYAGVASGATSALGGAVGDPGLSAAASAFGSALTQALSNGGLIGGLFGRGLTGGSAAYVATDQSVMPAVHSSPAPTVAPRPPLGK